MVVWGTQSGAKLLAFSRHEGDVLCAAWMSDSRIVSGGEDRTIIVWDAVTGTPVMEPLKGHSSGIVHVAFGAKTNVLVSASLDKIMLVWRGAARL